MIKIDPISVGPIRPSSPMPFETDKVEQGAQSFGEMLKSAIEHVDGLQTESNNMGMKLAMGEVQDVSQVMIAMEKASLALTFTQEIRDRVVDAFKTLMRTAM